MFPLKTPLEYENGYGKLNEEGNDRRYQSGGGDSHLLRWNTRTKIEQSPEGHQDNQRDQHGFQHQLPPGFHLKYLR